MATVEQRNKRIQLIFYFQGKRYATSPKTTEQRAADARRPPLQPSRPVGVAPQVAAARPSASSPANY